MLFTKIEKIISEIYSGKKSSFNIYNYDIRLDMKSFLMNMFDIELTELKNPYQIIFDPGEAITTTYIFILDIDHDTVRTSKFLDENLIKYNIVVIPLKILNEQEISNSISTMKHIIQLFVDMLFEDIIIYANTYREIIYKSYYVILISILKRCGYTNSILIDNMKLALPEMDCKTDEMFVEYLLDHEFDLYVLLECGYAIKLYKELEKIYGEQ